MLNGLRRYKAVTWSSYRKIPHYEKTMEQISAQREEILLFIARILMPQPDLQLEKVKGEVADLASKLCIPFDEALYYRWHYCQKLYRATERIRIINRNKIVL